MNHLPNRRTAPVNRHLNPFVKMVKYFIFIVIITKAKRVSSLKIVVKIMLMIRLITITTLEVNAKLHFML